MHKVINGFFVIHNAAMFKAANNFSFWVGDNEYTTLYTLVLIGSETPLITFGYVTEWT